MKLPHRRQFLRLAAGAAALPALSRVARAQTYPAQPVRVIVPFAPGGPTDIFARLIAQKLSQRVGKQFYVENIAGGTGNVGTGQAAKAAPDGHTVLITVDSYAINATFFPKIPYDPIKDFDPVTRPVASTIVLSVNPSVPAKTVKDLVALIKAEPRKYSVSSGGIATHSHLAGEQFRLSLGLDLVHVPYSGGGPAVASTVAGHTPIVFGSPPQAVPFIREDKLRPLAITSKIRSQTLPNVPTMAEAGYPDIYPDATEDQWIGVLVPAKTPENVITLLNREVADIVALPEMKERLLELGFDLVPSSQTNFANSIKVGIETWGKLIRAANLKPG